MIEFSPAKINIGLQILKKRDDGYHDLSSLMYIIPLTDIIEIVPASGQKGFFYSQSGIEVPGTPDSNLCYKAWHLFAKDTTEISIRMHLHKSIPIGAGLGGGSSNAAITLKLLNFYLRQGLSNDHLHNLARQLGSDCNLFIDGKSAMVHGRGDKLYPSPVDLNGFYLILLNPGIQINTAWAYSKIAPDATRPELKELLTTPVESWKDIIFNDFEPVIFDSYPDIAHLKSELYMSGAVYSAMSGSGSSVYGLFREKPDISPSLKKHLIFNGWL